MKAIGPMQEGIAAFDAGKYTRAVMQANKRNTLNDSVAEQDHVRATGRAAMGEQIAGQAGSGFELGSGSALDALRESLTNREFDIGIARRQGQQRAAGFQQQGDLAYMEGKAKLGAAVISGASKVIDSMAKAASGGAG